MTRAVSLIVQRSGFLFWGMGRTVVGEASAEIMGRFTGVDVGVVVLGGVMIVVGAWLVVDPIETVLRHGVAAHRGGGWSSSLAYRVSKSTSRMFGATAVVAGAGLIGVGRMREGPEESPCRK